MFEKITEWSINLLVKTGKTRRLFLSAVFLLMISPVIFLLIFTAISEFQSHTQSVLDAKQQTAYFSAGLLEEKFGRLSDIGANSLAKRPNLQKLAAEGKWSEAMKEIKKAPPAFIAIERIILADLTGTVTADTEQNSNIIGKNFAYRDWYQGVSKEWKPYVSEIFQAAGAPYYISVATAVPIKDENQKPVGILVIQTRVKSLTGWIKEIKTAQEETIYFIDQKGQSPDPFFNAEKEELLDFSKKPYFAEALKKDGYMAFTDEDETKKIAVYRRLPGFNWFAVIEQPTRLAFADRNYHLAAIAGIAIFALLLFCLTASYIFKIIFRVNEYRQKENTLLESIGNGLAGIDRNWNIIFWNKAAGEISGWTKEEVVGKPFREIIKFVKENDRKENIEFIEKAMLFGKTEQMENKTVLVRKDGKEIPIGDSAAPIFGPDGKVSGAIVIFRDMTKEREAQQISSEFSYASHQLRTPVNEAMWTLEALLGEKRKIKKLREGVNTAYNSLKSVHKLISQLLDVTTIDQKLVVPKFEMAKLIDIFGEIAEKTAKKAEERKVSLKFPAIPAMAAINTDQNLLKRILAEILENAIYYNKKGGEAEVKISFPEKTILIEIKDNGLGISEQEQPLAFTKFFRGSNKPQDIPGAGLGLFISREFTRLLKGKIWFESKEKEGTTFFISLPA